jgi:transposase
VGSVVDAVEPQIRKLLEGWPTMPATVIAERIGWTRGMTVLTERVRELRPVYLPPDPASRTRYVAGEIAQHDFWFPDIELPVGDGQVRTAKQLPVLTMILGYCRWLFAMLIPSRAAEDLYCGWWQHISALGAVPRVLVWDGEGAVGQYAGGRNKLTPDCHAFRGTLGAKVLILPPRDAEAKGLLERCHDYLERSFLPGRSFASPARRADGTARARRQGQNHAGRNARDPRYGISSRDLVTGSRHRISSQDLERPRSGRQAGQARSSTSVAAARSAARRSARAVPR